MCQIYSYLFTSKYAKNSGLYIYFIELLHAKFPNLSRRKILEVASGFIPGLALMLNELFNFNHNITCMDPKAFDMHIDNVTIIKKDFDSSTDISDYDLILAHCPCDTFDIIVDKVVLNPTEMCVQTCPCRKDAFANHRMFNYYMDENVDKLKQLEDLGYSIEIDRTLAYTYTMAPVVTVLKRKFPKIKFLGKKR